jgi:hypothetical protein
MEILFMDMRLYLKNILVFFMLFTAGFVFAEISAVPVQNVNHFSKDSYNLSSSQPDSYPVPVPSTALIFAGQDANQDAVQTRPSASLTGAAAYQAMSPKTGTEIEFWLGQTNHHAATVWAVDENNTTRLQHAIVSPADCPQLIIATENKYISDSERASKSALNFNDCLFESSIAPAGSGSGPPKGQPAPSIICTLIAGIITVASVGWRNIF